MSITESAPLSAEDLPHHGEIFRASNRRFAETIVFVHHFGGNKLSFKRHFALVNELGFDAATFNLSLHDTKFPLAPFGRAKRRRFGLRALWEDEIRDVLDALPGRKILYAFSMPAGAAFLALRHRKDVAAVICDGGPFLDVGHCIYNLFRIAYPIPTRALRLALTAISIPLVGAHWRWQVPAMLNSLPDQFPVLSFRGRLDQIVPTSAIELFFSHGPRLALERCALQAAHLDGFRRDPEVYRTHLQNFLERVGTHD